MESTVKQYRVKLLVTYEVSADSMQDAINTVIVTGEHPIFPHDVGGYVGEELVDVEEITL